MHPLHTYIATQLVDRLKTRRVVVWYDGVSEFAPFIAELRGGPPSAGEFAHVSSGGITFLLAEYAGSMFELRSIAEAHVRGETPDVVVLYIPGCERDRDASVLMELEKAGECYEPQLKRVARNVLRQRYTDGVIDEMLAPERVAYDDLARASADATSAEPPSILRGIFHDIGSSEGLLTSWLANDSRDAEIATKEATGELRKLIRSRLGVELPDDASLGKMRAVTVRYVLAGEFRADLRCPVPACLEGVARPKTKEQAAAIGDQTRRLRAGYPEAYTALADRVEEEFGLRNATLPAEALGTIDTFRFEEHNLLEYCGELISKNDFEGALELIAGREHSFWLDREVGRKAQWEACRRMADLGKVAVSVSSVLGKAGCDPSSWVQAYTSKDGWYRLDHTQRRLEEWVANLDEEPAEQPLAIVRRTYDDACKAMAEGFTKALSQAGWTVPGSLHQTRIFSEVASSRPRPVAYFLIDAMRYEMGVELAERLPKTTEVSVTHAMSALPSITTVGMAALQPGAASSFSVVDQAGKLGALIEGAFLPDVAARKKFAAARVPDLVDLSLDELLSLQPSKLAKKLSGAQVIFVRSQEIDHAGEAGFTFHARQVMDTVIDNIARAIRKLAVAGVEHAVVSADHGHLFFASDREEAMRTDPPGGETVELHRRCWIGRGGATPPGAVRVTAASLGYSSTLDFVFPTGSGVFRAGGDLAFHHGGPSLQEIVIPVVTVRTTLRGSTRESGHPVTASGLPQAITNRIFTVTFVLGDRQMLLGANAMVVRPLLMSAGKQVGAVGMAVDAEFDGATGCVTLEPNRLTTVAFLLKDESAATVRVVIQDPTTDAELYRSPSDIPVRLGV